MTSILAQTAMERATTTGQDLLARVLPARELADLTRPVWMNCSPPCFQMGQTVMVISELEHYTTFDVGHVEGIAIRPDGALVDSWWYLVHYTQGEWTGYREWIPGLEIAALCLPS